MKNKQRLITLADTQAVIAFFATDIKVYKNLLSSLPDAGTNNGFCDGINQVWPVGSKPAGASPYGAFDMAGNAWEWTSIYANDAMNGSGYILRGGGYFSIPSTLRTSKREVMYLPIMQHNGLGFRCGQTASN